MALFENVVVGADSSSTARQAVVAAADIAQLTGGTLHIVTAYDPKSVTHEQLPPEFRLTTTNVTRPTSCSRACRRSPRNAGSSRSSTPRRANRPRWWSRWPKTWTPI